MSKQKIDLEFEMNTMPGVLYKYVATPDGLAKWFADDAASEDGKVYSFLWHKEISRAIVLDSAVIVDLGKAPAGRIHIFVRLCFSKAFHINLHV